MILIPKSGHENIELWSTNNFECKSRILNINRKTKIQAELNTLRKEVATTVKLGSDILDKCAGYLRSRIRIRFEFIPVFL